MVKPIWKLWVISQSGSTLDHFPILLEVNVKDVWNYHQNHTGSKRVHPKKLDDLLGTWNARCIGLFLCLGPGWVSLTTSWGHWLVAWLVASFTEDQGINHQHHNTISTWRRREFGQQWTTWRDQHEIGNTVDGRDSAITSQLRWVYSLSRYSQGFIHPRWCRIPAINSRVVKAGWIGNSNQKKPSVLTVSYGFQQNHSLSVPTLKNPLTNRSQGPGPRGCARPVPSTKISFTSCCSYAYRFAAAPWLEFQPCSILWCFNGDWSKITESIPIPSMYGILTWIAW